MARSAANTTKPTQALRAAPSATPERMMRVGSMEALRARRRIANAVTTPAATPPAIAPCTPPADDPMAAPIAAPGPMPNRWGSARLLRSSPCSTPPQRARAAPTVKASSIRGVRRPHTTASACADGSVNTLSPSLRASTPSTSSAGSGTAPRDSVPHATARRSKPTIGPAQRRRLGHGSTTCVDSVESVNLRCPDTDHGRTRPEPVRCADRG